MKIRDIIIEYSSAGTTTATVSSGTPVAKHSKGKSYTGSPGKSGTKAPKQVQPKMQKPTDNGLDSDYLMAGQGTIKRSK
jgi:hypothetical protein